MTATTTVSGENEKFEVITGSKETMEYYRIVRTTIHGLDGLRLRASASGVAVSSWFVGAAFASEKAISLLGIASQPALSALFSILISSACLAISFFSAYQYILKLKMFGEFLIIAVTIAEKIEEKYIPDASMRMTEQFSPTAHASGKGDVLFMRLLRGIMIIDGLIFLVEFGFYLAAKFNIDDIFSEIVKIGK